MLDIPELDDMVCRQLARRELVQCSLVSKKWYSLVNPHLWRDISQVFPRHGVSAGALAFSRIVRDDHFAEQRCRLLSQEGVDQTTLSKYGHWIQLLPNPNLLLVALVERRQESTATPHELLLHLFKRCSPNVQLENFKMFLYDGDSDQIGRPIVDFILPRLRDLNIDVSLRSHLPSLLKLMDLLDQCSTILETLGLRIMISCPRGKNGKDMRIGKESKTLKSLKVLTLSLSPQSDNSSTEAFIPWLLRKCDTVEKLRVQNCCGDVQSLAQGMLAHMPSLCKISLGNHKTRNVPYILGNILNTIPDNIPDNKIAALLSGSRNGWKAVEVLPTASFGRAAMNALSDHFSTLEVLSMRTYDGDSSDGPIRALRSCANLHTCMGIATSYDSDNYLTIDAMAFIDQDATFSLKPWKCETSLKFLKVTITGIPRPYLEGDGAIEEAYIGQGREIQGRVYDRLARLTNLEVLWLGSDPAARSSTAEIMLRRRYINGRGTRILEMSLESRLDKLSGLKKLKELSIAGMVTKVGAREVQWMVENWPRLRIIRGLDYGNAKEALRWLRENHPEVKVPQYHGSLG